jgi:2-methylfumaryl-CoA hydratase
MTDWTDPETFDAVLDRVETLPKGNCFEDFTEGDVVEHDPGIRLSRHGSEGWAGQTLNHDPAYWRADEAERRGFEDVPVHPDYLLACVMGCTVEALSEKGGYFLGRTDVRYHADAVYPGTDLTVESRVVSKATSSSRPAYGIVTWETTGVDADGRELVSYERTNMIPRRDPPAETDAATDGGEDSATTTRPGDDPDLDLPERFVAPDGGYFEDYVAALDDAGDDGAVAMRHERGRTMDDQLLEGLPLATLNTARQHHNADAMADSPSGEMVVYGDVTRSVALAHARSDERTWREVGASDERFHDFVTRGDTVYGFTRVLDTEDVDHPDAGRVRFQHVAYTGDRRPVYSGTRTALVERKPSN